MVPYRGGICTRIIAICQTSAQRMYKCTLCIHTHTHMHPCVCVCVCTYIQSAIIVGPCAQRPWQFIASFALAFIHTRNVHTYVCMTMCACVHVCTCIHTCVLCTYVHARSCSCSHSFVCHLRLCLGLSSFSLCRSIRYCCCLFYLPYSSTSSTTRIAAAIYLCSC